MFASFSKLQTHKSSESSTGMFVRPIHLTAPLPGARLSWFPYLQSSAQCQIRGVGFSRQSKHSALNRAQAAHSSSASQLPAPGLVSICAQCVTRFLLVGISSEAFITNPLPGWVFAHRCCAQAPHFSSCTLQGWITDHL